MARRKEHDAQVDPFTAGEPTLPWDEPGVFGGLFNGIEPETCILDGSPYDGPTKTRDDYEAPSADDTADHSRREQSPGLSEARERKRQVQAERNAARRAVKAAPKDKRGPSTLGKTLRVIVIFVVLANVLPALLYGIGDLFSDLTSGTGSPELIEPEAPSYDGHDPSPGIDMDSLDDDERTCVQICEAYLQAIASEQSPERTAVIDGLNQSMMETTGYTCEELGIDANAYADWALSNFSYRIDSCYAHTDEGTASLYLYTWGPDLLDMRATLRQSVYSYMSELDTGEAGAKRPLTENKQAHVRELFAEAIENAEMDSESFLGFQLAFEDGTWVLDLEQAQYQLGIPLGY
ncbi:hypothetical protein [Collinsella intestinalis]|uniref:hypothetical protein n=1 Tax=Collinsella intestinalis TaxID=147207 RepID=UPI0022E8CF41|nr:hypothetical protein [Collinsella intestinalis]